MGGVVGQPGRLALLVVYGGGFGTGRGWPIYGGRLGGAKRGALLRLTGKLWAFGSHVDLAIRSPVVG
jgi:hypothetical protein